MWLLWKLSYKEQRVLLLWGSMQLKDKFTFDILENVCRHVAGRRLFFWKLRLSWRTCFFDENLPLKFGREWNVSLNLNKAWQMGDGNKAYATARWDLCCGRACVSYDAPACAPCLQDQRIRSNVFLSTGTDAAMDSLAVVHYPLFQLAPARPPLPNLYGLSFRTVAVFSIVSSKTWYWWLRCVSELLE